jgi:hypothetical protein
MKRSKIVATGSMLLAATVGIYLYLFKPAPAPAGQKPLVEMNEAALNGVKADFNQMAGSTRVILLLSPT